MNGLSTKAINQRNKMSFEEVKKRLTEDLELTKELIKISGVTPKPLLKEMVVKVGKSLKQQAEHLKENKKNFSEEEVITLTKNLTELVITLAKLKTIMRNRRREVTIEEKENKKKEERILN